jgi:methylenetetrahydrofolate dehydrogenase (NADP+) / methenyltetrahydrofolate cyclohydrolase
VCNSKTPQIETFTQSADIVVVAAGSPRLLKKEMIAEKTIVIDVGFSVLNGEILGDADFKNIYEHHPITPNPGGVGPMTVAFLMKNVLKAYKIQV